MTPYRCNLIVPGFAKSGTSSLHEYLNLHPGICMSSNKEPHHFAFTDKVSRGAEDHNALFKKSDGNEVWFGESSTSYAVWEPALCRIKSNLSNTRLIVLLRDPVERLLSHYGWMYALGLEPRELMAALDNETKEPTLPELSRKGCYPWYRRHSNYSYFCELMKFIFGDENILFINSDDLKNNPERTLNQCFRFLQLSPIKFEGVIHVNKTCEKTTQRTLGLDQVVKPIPRGLRDFVDPNHTIREALLKFLGRKGLKAKAPTAEEISAITKLVAKDSAYYRNLFTSLSSSSE